MGSITVLGCGIVGLTTALKLQENGFKVTIIAKERFEHSLSSKVGAIWFPFEIYPKEKANHWSSLAYAEYQSDIKPNNGIAFLPFITAYDEDSNTDWTQQLPKGKVRKAASSELPKGIKKAYISTVPLAEPLSYLPYLFNRFINKGGSFQKQAITTLQQASTLDKFVINCTGLGAKELCNDEDLQPMRGQILRCKKMGIPSYADATKKGALSYIINRSNDCVIGGTDYENDWNMNIEEDDTNLIINRLTSGGFAEKPPEILEKIVGLRPKRSAVRFEFDANFPSIFHNYGHGGAGFTVAWGCAIEIADMLVNHTQG